MDFGGAQKHGIYRFIPVVYDREGGAYKLDLEMKSVQNERGENWNYQTNWQNRDVMIRIGDPEITVSGVQTYVLTYKVRNGVNFFKDAPEVYWNATGNQWPFAMNQASARFYPPPGVAVSSTKTDAFFGPAGSTTRAQITPEANSILFVANNLQPSQGLTFVAGMPKGAMSPPTFAQQLARLAAKWWPLFVLPLGALGLLYPRYLASGRDAERGLPAQVEWSPPTDLSPAEVGTLVDERCDMTDILSTLIDLAARGYLTIAEVPSQSFLFLSGKDYVFVRSNKDVPFDEPLAPHEAMFLRGVFGRIESYGEQVSLSSLKNHFYVHLSPITDSIYNSLTKKGLFTSNPQTTRSGYQMAGFGVGGLGAALFFFPHLQLIVWSASLVLTGIVIWSFARAMPAKTATGSRKLRECVGFGRFVKLAEKDRIEKLITDDPTIFGRLLPYAMVLGVGDEWANKFADLLREPPNWFIAPHGSVFTPQGFVNDLGSGMNTMGQTFQSQPQKSGAGSGSSGFSGGSSGGGFGGGGGGSW